MVSVFSSTTASFLAVDAATTPLLPPQIVDCFWKNSPLGWSDVWFCGKFVVLNGDEIEIAGGENNLHSHHHKGKPVGDEESTEHISPNLTILQTQSVNHIHPVAARKQHTNVDDNAFPAAARKSRAIPRSPEGSAESYVLIALLPKTKFFDACNHVKHHKHKFETATHIVRQAVTNTTIHRQLRDLDSLDMQQTDAISLVSLGLAFTLQMNQILRVGDTACIVCNLWLTAVSTSDMWTTPNNHMTWYLEWFISSWSELYACQFEIHRNDNYRWLSTVK